MSVFMVTWNLNKERGHYANARAAFIQRLERYSHVRDPGLESVWWVESTASASAVCDDLLTALDANDRLFVCQVQRGGHQGFLKKAVWSWINARI